MSSTPETHVFSTLWGKLAINKILAESQRIKWLDLEDGKLAVNKNLANAKVALDKIMEEYRNTEKRSLEVLNKFRNFLDKTTDIKRKAEEAKYDFNNPSCVKGLEDDIDYLVKTYPANKDKTNWGILRKACMEKRRHAMRRAGRSKYADRSISAGGRAKKKNKTRKKRYRVKRGGRTRVKRGGVEPGGAMVDTTYIFSLVGRSGFPLHTISRRYSENRADHVAEVADKFIGTVKENDGKYISLDAIRSIDRDGAVRSDGPSPGEHEGEYFFIPYDQINSIEELTSGRRTKPARKVRPPAPKTDESAAAGKPKKGGRKTRRRRKTRRTRKKTN